LFAPGATIWHNIDDRAIPADRSAATLGRLHEAMPNVDWEDVAVHPTPSGFVWQAVVVGNAPGGPVRAPTCMVVVLSEAGLIQRLDEYLDPGGLAALRAQP
jgi:hypothetical protein